MSWKDDKYYEVNVQLFGFVLNSLVFSPPGSWDSWSPSKLVFTRNTCLCQTRQAVNTFKWDKAVILVTESFYTILRSSWPIQRQSFTKKDCELLEGTVSPDNAFYFRFCKIKSVLPVRQLIVFNSCYFLVLYSIYENIHFKTASMKTLTNYADPYWKPIQRAFTGFC
jgi:hypothetical protein